MGRDFDQKSLEFHKKRNRFDFNWCGSRSTSCMMHFMCTSGYVDLSIDRVIKTGFKM